MKQNNVTNIIKCICAFLVIFSHSFALAKGQVDPLSSYTNGVIDFGALAVGVFFFYSGYYITKSIVKKGSKKFFRKRLSRLLPSLAIVIILCVFVLGPIVSNLSAIDYFTNKNTYLYILNCIFIPIHSLPGVFTNNIYGSTINGALWTLSVEFLCYVYIFIIYKLQLINKKRYPLVFIIAIILSIIGNQLFSYLNLTILSAMIRPFLIFSFAILISLYEEEIKVTKVLLAISIFIFIGSLLIKNLILINTAMIILLPYILYSTILLSNGYSIKIGLLSNISYQLYLVGFPIQQLLVYLSGGDMNIIINFTESLILAIIVAYPLYLLEEKINNRLVKINFL